MTCSPALCIKHTHSHTHIYNHTRADDVLPSTLQEAEDIMNEERKVWDCLQNVQKLTDKIFGARVEAELFKNAGPEGPDEMNAEYANMFRWSPGVR